MNKEQALSKFKELEEKLSHYRSILALVQWDMETGAPKQGVPYMASAMGSLSTEVFRIMTSEEMGECLQVLTEETNKAEWDLRTSASLREAKRSYEQSKKIPEKLYSEFVVLTANAQSIWAEAKKTDNYSLYEPTLQRIIEINREFTQCYGYHEHPYDALLDLYEPGYTVGVLDPLFSNLKDRTLSLLQRIQASLNKPREDIFGQGFDKQKQKEFCYHLLPKLGFNLEAGVLGESAHPFATGISLRDVRITTRYIDDVRSSVLSVIHETGHALYEQGIDPELEGTFLRDGASMGIHESQSRFLENMVGRSREFWTSLYPDLQKTFLGELQQVSLEDFYRSLNIVEPSLIRTEADELTYNLHIMIRYELEKAMIQGDINAKDLPEIWNSKMREYLGVVPPTNAEGVLQDIHWSFGEFGYFPSYTLGNLYSAQIYHVIQQQIPEFHQLLTQGNLLPIREWLREQIHQYGKTYTPGELIEKISGEKLNADYLIQYFEEKFSKVYQIEPAK